MIKFIKELISRILSKYNQFFFVGSTDILPPPLEKDEEIQYVIKCQQGDINARNLLIEHNLRLVVYIAKRFESKKVLIEDLILIGSIFLSSCSDKLIASNTLSNNS